MRDRLVILGGLAILHLCGCSSAKEPFRVAQICLSNGAEITDIANTMRLFESESMSFADNSRYTQAELRALESEVLSLNAVPVNLSLRRRDGMGVAVGNIGFPNNQVVVSFTSGENFAEAEAFADSVVATLEERWRLYPVPHGQGALPLKDCQSDVATRAEYPVER